MSNHRDPVRIVFSTGVGRVCATCGWPADDCRCSRKVEEPVPKKLVAKLRLESKGRAGKSVTVIDGLPRNEVFLESLAKELKKACGTGGAVREGAVELQGDCRARLRTLLEAQGFAVRG